MAPPLDTNVVIREITRDDPRLSARAHVLLRQLAAGTAEAQLTEAVLVECAQVLGSKALYNLSRAEIAQDLAVIIRLRGVRLVNKRRYLRALSLYATTPALSFVDALLVVPNDRLLDLATRRTQLTEAFKLADDVMLQGIRGIADLITTTGLINVDFADVRAVLTSGGLAHMALGTGFGPTRGEDAARRAIASPLLETPLRGARAVLLNCTGGPDLTLHEVSRAADLIAAEVDPDATIIFGAFIHPKLLDEFRLTVIAAGLPPATRAS